MFHLLLYVHATQVCGTDGVTYQSICALRIQPDVRFDYRGEYSDNSEHYGF